LAPVSRLRFPSPNLVHGDDLGIQALGLDRLERQPRGLEVRVPTSQLLEALDDPIAVERVELDQAGRPPGLLSRDQGGA